MSYTNDNVTAAEKISFIPGTNQSPTGILAIISTIP